MWETFSKHRIVFEPWQENATKDLQYLNAMIRNAIMQKMEIPL